MADMIRLPDGSLKICFGGPEAALGELIREKLGYDAAEIYEKIVDERDTLAYELSKYEDDDDVIGPDDDSKKDAKERSSGGFSEDAMGSGGKTCIVEKGSAIWV